MESRKTNGTDEPICRVGIETDVKNKRVDTVGKREGGTNWEIRIDIYAWPCVKQITNGACCTAQGAQPGALWWPRWVGLGVRLGRRLRREEIYANIYSVHCTAEMQHCKAIIINRVVIMIINRVNNKQSNHFFKKKQKIGKWRQKRSVKMQY